MTKKVVNIIGTICIIHLGLYSYFIFKYDFLLLIISWSIFFSLIFFNSLSNRRTIKRSNYFKVSLREILVNKNYPFIIVGYIIIGILFYYLHINSHLRKIESNEKDFFLVIFILFIIWKLWFNEESHTLFLTSNEILVGIFLEKKISYRNMKSYNIDNENSTIEFLSNDSKKYKFRLDRGFLKTHGDKLEELLNKNVAQHAV